MIPRPHQTRHKTKPQNALQPFSETQQLTPVVSTKKALSANTAGKAFLLELMGIARFTR